MVRGNRVHARIGTHIISEGSLPLRSCTSSSPISCPSSAVELLPASPDGPSTREPAARADVLAADLADADALVVRSATTVDETLIAAAPKLRVIARAGTGVDNVDVAAATARGILVMNAPGANSVSVAEHALALMLSLARSVPAADATMKRGVWDKKKLTGVELRGKTLGLVGLGRIGQEVAARARAFGMEIVAHDPFISEQVAAHARHQLLDARRAVRDAPTTSACTSRRRPRRGICLTRRVSRKCKTRRPHRQHGARRADRRGRARRRDRIGARRRRGARRVRESSRRRTGALAQLPQVVATPHIAASTVEAQELVGLETAAAVRDFLRYGVIRNAVNFPADRRRGDAARCSRS